MIKLLYLEYLMIESHDNSHESIINPEKSQVSSFHFAEKSWWFNGFFDRICQNYLVHGGHLAVDEHHRSAIAGREHGA